MDLPFDESPSHALVLDMPSTTVTLSNEPSLPYPGGAGAKRVAGAPGSGPRASGKAVPGAWGLDPGVFAILGKTSPRRAYPLNPPLDFASLPGGSKQRGTCPLRDDSRRLRQAPRRGGPASPDAVSGSSRAPGDRAEQPRERRHLANRRRGNYRDSYFIGNGTLCQWRPIRVFLVRPQNVALARTLVSGRKGTRTSRGRSQLRQPTPVVRWTREGEAMSLRERVPLHSSGDENPCSERRQCEFHPRPPGATRAPMTPRGASAGIAVAPTATPTRPAQWTDEHHR
jgi:hypothetical protein